MPILDQTWLWFQKLFDYEVDSDDEWEEEEPGESVSSDEVCYLPLITTILLLYIIYLP